MKYALGLFIVFIFIMTGPVSAALTVNDDLKREIIGRDIEFLEDRDNSLTIEKVSTISAWKKLSEDSVSFGFTPSPYWFRFTVHNNTKSKIECLFEISYPLLDSVRFYRPDGPAGFSMIETGDMMPFSHRDVDDVNFIFLLKQEPGETVYYFRIQTTSSLNFTPSIMSLKAYLHKKNSDQPLQWIYYGIMIVMLLYNLFIFLFSRDKSYIYYVLFIASWILFQMSLYGNAFQFLWPDSVQWCSKTVPLFIDLSMLSYAIFLVINVGTKKNFPVIHRLTVGLFIVPYIVLSLLSLCLPYVPYSLMIKLSTIASAFHAVFFYSCAIIMAMKKSRPAMFHVIAFTCLIGGILLYVLKTFGVIPMNVLTQWSLNISSSFVVVLLSLGLADKINLMGKEQLKAERATIKANNEAFEVQKKMLTHLQESKLFEEALRESEERYRLVMENINDAIFICKLDGHIKFLSSSIIRLAGYTAEEMIGVHFLHFVGKDYRKRELEMYFQQVTQGIEFTEHEYPFIIKDGTVLWASQTVRMVKNKDGVIEFFGVVRDISEKKKAEEALKRSEEKYRHLIVNANEIIFKADKIGNIIFSNLAFQKKFGYTEDEINHLNYLDLIPPENRESESSYCIAKIKQKIEESRRVLPVLTKSGETLWVEESVKSIKDETGRIVEFDVIIHDITTIKKAEDARRDLEEAKTRFFSNISHEIRTPLTLMLGPIESVLEGNYAGEIDGRFFENLHRNTLRLLKLVNNLLDFSKIEAGKMIMKVLQADIVYFARGYFESMKAVGETRKIEMRFYSSADSIMLYFDPERLDKVMMNLLSNAFKFTDPGGVITITVSEDHEHCRLIVADTGEGIPEKSMGSIFERFNQADTASTRKHDGTGIGLALAKELVEMHGGVITVASRYVSECPDNHGSHFTITLPKGKTHFENNPNIEILKNFGLDDYVRDYRTLGIREMAELRNDDGVCENDKDLGSLPANGAKKIILVVDDNVDMRNFLKVLLQEKYRVVLAENGKEGLRMARSHRPDLIVSDVMMPVMNGFEMLTIIKKDEELKTTPVIMLTADTELVNKVAGLEFGADDYVHKPFNSLELMTRVSSLLKNYEYQQIINRRNFEIESELDVARLLQERLLPLSMPDVPGFVEHAVYIPMDKVGGDFYDVACQGGCIYIFIADVSGHGLPGAFLATVTKIALENITARSTPESVLYQLNTVILRHTVNSNFVTAFYAAIDVNTRIMRYSCAGHVPPLLYRKGNSEFIELATKGPLLGWLHNNEILIEGETIQLESGDRVIFYTDGIIECSKSDNELYGDVRFRKIIRDYAGNTAEEFSNELMKELETFKGGKTFDDDITMLVLDVL